MPRYTLAIHPATQGVGGHDPSAVLFEDGTIAFGVEEERFTRTKHAADTFPSRAIRACLDSRDLALPDVDRVVIPWQPGTRSDLLSGLYDALTKPSLPSKAFQTAVVVRDHVQSVPTIENQLAKIGTPVPPIEKYHHHRCHAASAFYPSGFDSALVVTVDALGDWDATVVWKGDATGLHRIRSYRWPNSLGALYAGVTEYLGYRAMNGEGKVMGLAPYGERNPEIEAALREVIDVGVDYDVTEIAAGPQRTVANLERLFGRPRRTERGPFSDWEKDLAHVVQKLVEETVLAIVERYCLDLHVDRVGLAGGVALNCKMNKRVMESDVVDEVFIQPVANDAGTVIGAGLLDHRDRGDGGDDWEQQSTVYWGPRYSTAEIQEVLDECKIAYSEPEDLTEFVAEQLADGALVGWFQDRLEMGPRALGNRSILADPRTTESRDRVNEFVKHREEWRPFAPSMLEEAAAEYFADPEPAPFMIKTFDVIPEKREEIQGVLHEADATTRPQTVRRDQNPRYYDLIREFGERTGVPVLLNTSFNDNGEPIVTTPAEAIKDFFGMGLDLLVLEGTLVEKARNVTATKEIDVGVTPPRSPR